MWLIAKQKKIDQIKLAQTEIKLDEVIPDQIYLQASTADEMKEVEMGDTGNETSDTI